MADVLTAQQRSFNMSRIKGRDTKPELVLRKALWAAGLRYRLQNKLPGKPDLVFPQAKLAVFVDGCFWHGCPDHMTWPKSNEDFWKSKIRKNMDRDERVNALIKESGWRCLRFWEHQIKSELDAVTRIIRDTIEMNSR